MKGLSGVQGTPRKGFPFHLPPTQGPKPRSWGSPVLLNSEEAPHKYTKHVIKDPFNNRQLIAKVAKKAVGV
jgi:hypothetical protein